MFVQVVETRDSNIAHLFKFRISCTPLSLVLPSTASCRRVVAPRFESDLTNANVSLFNETINTQEELQED